MTSQQADVELGEIAYDAYCVQKGYGEVWDALTGTEHNAWIAAARSVEAHVRGQIETYAA